MREFEKATEQELCNNYVDDFLRNTSAPNKWPGLLFWAGSSPVRLTALLQRNPPIDELAKHVMYWGRSNSSTIVSIIEYGKEPLVSLATDQLRANSKETWLFSLWPSQGRTPSVCRALAQYTQEGVAQKNGRFAFEDVSFYSEWLAEAVCSTPMDIVCRQQVVVALTNRIGKRDTKITNSVRKGIQKILRNSSAAERQLIANYCGQHKVVLDDVVKKRSFPQPTKRLFSKVFEGQVLSSVEVSSVLRQNKWSALDVKNLLASGVDPHTIVDKNFVYGECIGQKVVRLKLVDVFPDLIAAGFDPNTDFKDGRTLVQIAVESKSVRVLQAVLDIGAVAWKHSRVKGMFGTTHPFLSAPSNNPKMLPILAGQPNADVNITDSDGNTALFLLYPPFLSHERKSNAVIASNILLELGVDPNHRNTAGETVLDKLRRHSQAADVVSTLESLFSRFQSYKIATALDAVVDSTPSVRRKKM